MFFCFNDTATTEIYTLSLHDALPISRGGGRGRREPLRGPGARRANGDRRLRRLRHLDQQRGRGDLRRRRGGAGRRSEEHTSELQSRQYLVCRLLLEKKNNYAVSLVIH